MGHAGPPGRDAGRPRRRVLSLAAWVELLLPTRCVGCGGVGTGDGAAPVCPGCRTRLGELPRPRCPRCHHPRLPEAGPCSLCAAWPDLLVRARSVTRFLPPAPELIHGMKYQGWTSLAAFMGERMARLVRLEGCVPSPGVVVPIPTTPRRLRERGFNPARLLAEAVSRSLGIPLADGLSRPRESPRQVGLPPSERAANVRDQFVPNRALSGVLNHQHVLLVDDVLTTGATGAEAARAAGECGARTVSLVTFARALPQDPDSGGHPI